MTGAAVIDAVERILAEPLARYASRGGGIGFVGPDVPIEVLLASGRPFGHLPWRASEQTPWADARLESSFPYWARSILEQWHAGAFDDIATVVFSRADDASQRLYYYVAELQRRGELTGPEPFLFDIAYVPRASSLEHTAAAIVDLMRALEVESSRLADGVLRANDLRRRCAGIERDRSANGPLYERLWRAALWSDPTEWLDRVAVPAEAGGRRLLLAGSMPVDARLHEAVAAAGASIVAEAHALAPARFGPELSGDGNRPELLLARHLRQSSIAPRAFLNRSAWLLERVRAAGAEGVILWLTREDEALAWSVPSEERALRAAGLPTLVLAAARWQADDGALDRIAGFVRECADATA